MDAIINWFNDVSSAISNCIDYVVGLIEDLVKMVVMLAQSAAQIPTLLSFLPPPVVTLLVSFLTAAILYKVLGREG